MANFNFNFNEHSSKTNQHSASLRQVYVSDSASFNINSPKTKQKLTVHYGRDSPSFIINSPKTELVSEEVKMELKTSKNIDSLENLARMTIDT